MVTDALRLLLQVAEILDRLEIRYSVGGSLASGMHGELRATNDIDVLIELPSEKIGTLLDALRPAFDVWEDTVRTSVTAGRSFSALHVAWHVKVDFFPAGHSPLDEQELRRRRAIRLPGDPDRDVWFASAEDIVLRKIDWFRRSGGTLERQLRDVVGVLKLQGEQMDLGYVRARAHDLRLDDLLERCLADAGLGAA